MTRKSSAFALFALIAAACLGTCLGHGYLEVPAAKQLSQRDITPQNGQGNGARNPGESNQRSYQHLITAAHKAYECLKDAPLHRPATSMRGCKAACHSPPCPCSVCRCLW